MDRRRPFGTARLLPPEIGAGGSATRFTQALGRLGLWASAVGLGVLLFVGAGIPEAVRVPLTYLSGCCCSLVGVRQAYAKSTAEAELIKQYEFMHRIFQTRVAASMPGTTTSSGAC